MRNNEYLVIEQDYNDIENEQLVEHYTEWKTAFTGSYRECRKYCEKRVAMFNATNFFNSNVIKDYTDIYDIEILQYNKDTINWHPLVSKRLQIVDKVFYNKWVKEE